MLWLVWRYEGDYTLFDLLQKRDWPYNAEALMRGRSMPSQNRSPRRKLAIVRSIMKSILLALKACHNSGAPAEEPLALTHLPRPHSPERVVHTMQLRSLSGASGKRWLSAASAFELISLQPQVFKWARAQGTS